MLLQRERERAREGHETATCQPECDPGRFFLSMYVTRFFIVTVKDNQNPKWSNEMFLATIPEQLLAQIPVAAAASTAASTDDAGDDDEPETSDAVVGGGGLKFKPSELAKAQLRIEVFDQVPLMMTAVMMVMMSGSI